jgi:hypothetical protein
VGGERVNNWRLSPCFYLSLGARHTEIYSIKCVLVLPVTLVKGRRKYWACKSDFALLLGTTTRHCSNLDQNKRRAPLQLQILRVALKAMYIQIRAFFESNGNSQEAKGAVP